MITRIALADVFSLSPLPVYLFMTKIFGENVLILFGLNLIIGAIVGGLAPKYFGVIILISSALSAIAVACMAKSTDSMWIIGCVVVFLATLLQFPLVPLGQSVFRHFIGDKAV